MLTWKPYPKAVRYVIYLGRKKIIKIQGGKTDHAALQWSDSKYSGGSIGLGVVLTNGAVVMRQDVKWPVAQLPDMKHLSVLLAQAQAMLKQVVKPEPVVPMHYTPRQRAISHLYYCAHCAELVLGNSTATPANVRVVDKMLSSAMRALRK